MSFYGPSSASSQAMLVFEALPIHLCSCDGGSLSLCVRGGALCTEGCCCCLVVHWCLFSFGAHMCKFLQLIVVVIPFFHFLPKWQPGNAKASAKQHRACSSSSQGPLEIWTKRSIFLMSLRGELRIFTKSKCIMINFIQGSSYGEQCEHFII